MSISPIITKYREAILVYYRKAIIKIKEDLSRTGKSENPRSVSIAYLLVYYLEGI